MALHPLHRTCDVCGREIPSWYRHVELRALAVLLMEDGQEREMFQRSETCSPACTLTAARAVIERAWARA